MEHGRQTDALALIWLPCSMEHAIFLGWKIQILRFKKIRKKYRDIGYNL
jgi:hypothetical protein